MLTWETTMVHSIGDIGYQIEKDHCFLLKAELLLLNSQWRIDVSQLFHLSKKKPDNFAGFPNVSLRCVTGCFVSCSILLSTIALDQWSRKEIVMQVFLLVAFCLLHIHARTSIPIFWQKSVCSGCKIQWFHITTSSVTCLIKTTPKLRDKTKHIAFRNKNPSPYRSEGVFQKENKLYEQIKE